MVDEEHDPAYKQEDGARYHARDMAVVRARGAEIPIVLASATPSVETEVNARRGRYGRLASARAVRRRSIFPPSRRSTCAPKVRRAAASSRRGSPRRCGLRSAAASRRCCSSIVAAMRRSRSAANAGSGSHVRTATPGWSITASAAGWSATIAASRCRRRRNARNARRPTSFVAVGPGVERLEQEAAELFPASRILVLSSDLVELVERLREELDDIAQGRVRHRDRDAARRQGASFSEAQSRRRHRRRSRSGERRSARGRAHVPIAASGHRPRRPRGGPRRRLPADASARASGDAGAGGRRSRRLLHERDRAAREDALSAVRPPRGPADLGR